MSSSSCVNKVHIYFAIIIVFSIVFISYFHATSKFKFILLLNLQPTQPRMTSTTTTTTSATTTTVASTKTMGNLRCPDVLRHMTKGSWVQNSMTLSEKREFKTFVGYTMNMKGDFERRDRRCGNVTITQNMTTSVHWEWFRGVCDPLGPHPCCYHGLCVARPVGQCQCEECYDLRPRVYAEWATWHPHDKRCALGEFSRERACGLLAGARIFFLGDSLVRQLFLALVKILQGNSMYGGLKPRLSKDILEKCKGRYSYPARFCLKYIDYNPVVCDSKVKVIYKDYSNSVNIKNMIHDVRSLRNIPQSLIVSGAGIWFHLDHNRTKEYVNSLIAAANYTHRTQKDKPIWPRVLWHSVHSFSPLKFPKERNYTNPVIKQYNAKVGEAFEKHGIDVLKTNDITYAVRSQDGTHYGPGANTVKAKIILHYIQQLKHNGQW